MVGMRILVSVPRALPGGFSLENGVLDFTPLLDALADCNDPREGADLTHGTLLEALVAWAQAAASQTGLETVALAGGCLLNRYLAEDLPRRLEQVGLRPLVALGIPPNDGSISLGQAWVARRMLAARKPQLEVLD